MSLHMPAHLRAEWNEDAKDRQAPLPHRAARYALLVLVIALVWIMLAVAVTPLPDQTPVQPVTISEGTECSPFGSLANCIYDVTQPPN